nr:MAG: hypothetical protein KatS3mg041_0841 [Bacteroidota bacterium]
MKPDPEELLRLAYRLRGSGHFADLFLEETCEQRLHLRPDGTILRQEKRQSGTALRVWPRPEEVRFHWIEGTDPEAIRSAIETHRLPGSSSLPSDYRIVRVSLPAKTPETVGLSSQDIPHTLKALQLLLQDSLPGLIGLEATVLLHHRHKYIAHTEGLFVAEPLTLWTVRVEAQQRSPKGLLRGTFLDGGAGPARWLDLPERVLRGLIEELEQERETYPLRPGAYPALFGPGSTGMLWHEALGHRVEADVWSAGGGRPALGSRIASEAVTIWDEGTARAGDVGLFDDEGTPRQRTLLITRGRLVDLLTDRLWSARLNRRPTGNGRRASFRDPPLPRMTNTVFAPGPHEPNALLEGIETGLWILRLGSGGLLPRSARLWFEVLRAYWVEKGRPRYPVHPFRIIASSSQLLREVLAVGSDLQWATGYGWCVKAGQVVPVCAAAPSVFIRRIPVRAPNRHL